MFFYAAKLLWILLAPTTVLIGLLVVGSLGLFTRWARLARGVTAGAALALAFLAIAPVGNALLRPLEDRFSQPAANMPAPTGVILLGGAVNGLVTEYRGGAQLSEAGTRMTEAAALLTRYPQARLVFTGGSAALLGSDISEADVARRLFESLGFSMDRFVFEGRSRNTYENAVFTKELLQPKPGERWLLVTSAAHMPRSVGIFRKIGFEVTPYPVDYFTTGQPRDYRPEIRSLAENLSLMERALREWVGLAAYWATGRTSALFPAP